VFNELCRVSYVDTAHAWVGIAMQCDILVELLKAHWVRYKIYCTIYYKTPILAIVTTRVQ
jgi:hypothetical protein